MSTLLSNNPSRLPSRDLVGKFPPDIGRLYEMKVLVVNDNDFQSSSIPTTIGNCTKLTIVNLSGAEFAGIIPAELGDLIELDQLHLHVNGLIGHIPEALGKLVKITELNLDQNKLSGPIPDSIGNLVNLVELFLYTNYLEVRILTF
jgi:Leucine-rich repeat (LRR) protein